MVFHLPQAGIELKLLAKLFSREEAVLAGEMRLSFEPAAEIACRAGLDPGQYLPDA